MPEEQIVSGLIGLSSYPGPLPGGELPKPGMVYWTPPFTKMTFSGPRARMVADALDGGGLPSKVVKDTLAEMAFGGPALQFLFVALELANWSFVELRARRELMTLNHRATREALVVASMRLGIAPPLGLRLLRPWILRLATRLPRYLVPFDFELFLKKHFSKVGDQTELTLTTMIRIAKTQGSPASSMKELLEAMVESRAAALPSDAS